MAEITVNFTFHSGVKRQLFRNVRLSGSWDATGKFSNQWTEVRMAASQDATDCDAFNARVSFDAPQMGTTFQWGVVADIAGAPNTWVVDTEVPDENSNQRYRSFALAAGATQQDYWFATGRRFGAQKWLPQGSASPGIRFAVWAPHAKNVEVLFAPFDLTNGTPTGYIADDGTGMDPAAAVVPLVSKGGGIWESDFATTASLANFGDYTPRFSEENVRQMFTSSAAALLDDFHIDGLRLDLTDAIHQDKTLNANGASIGSANLYGIKFLRELARTVKMVNPAAFLIAEDHTGWSAMTQSPDQEGVGFDAVWYADFYHHLIGDGNYGDNYAKLLKIAGYGAAGPLNMDYFAGALVATQYNKITYHENHDEAGNDTNTERTIVTAVNYAPLIGATRKYAEGRSRFSFGLAGR